VASLVLDDELALVDLFLVDLLGVDIVLLPDHLAGKDRADRSTAVDADHDDVVKVDLLALGEFIEPHGIAALDGDTDLLVLCTVKVLLDELGHEEGSAVERTGGLCNVLGVGDDDRNGIVQVNALGYGKDCIDHFRLERKLPEGGYCATEFGFLLDLRVIRPGIEHIAFL